VAGSEALGKSFGRVGHLMGAAAGGIIGATAGSAASKTTCDLVDSMQRPSGGSGYCNWGSGRLGGDSTTGQRGAEPPLAGSTSETASTLPATESKPYEWVPIARGDPLPAGAVLAGTTKSDGEVYVGRSACGVGKLNTEAGKMYNIWVHSGNSTQDGEILVMHCRHMWQKVKKGDLIPDNAIYGGWTKTDGMVYPCRSKDFEVGKLNTEGGKLCNMWYHGHFFAKTEGEILVVHPEAALSRCAERAGA
jgi:hypothetical protein